MVGGWITVTCRKSYPWDDPACGPVV
jgi:hypothetical protein